MTVNATKAAVTTATKAVNPKTVTSSVSWLSKTAQVAGSAAYSAAATVSRLASAVFQAIANYSGKAYNFSKSALSLGVAAVKAHPGVAAGAAVTALVLATAAYVYSSRTAQV